MERRAPCPRHARCVCYRIIPNVTEWVLFGVSRETTLVIMFPRFGVKADFKLAPSKICFRKGVTVAKLSDLLKNIAAAKNSSASLLDAMATSTSAGAKVLLRLGVQSLCLSPGDGIVLRRFFPFRLIWYADVDGKLLPPEMCKCSCGTVLRFRDGIRMPSKLLLGRNVLYQALIPNRFVLVASAGCQASQYLISFLKEVALCSASMWSAIGS